MNMQKTGLRSGFDASGCIFGQGQNFSVILGKMVYFWPAPCYNKPTKGAELTP